MAIGCISYLAICMYGVSERTKPHDVLFKCLFAHYEILRVYMLLTKW